MSSGNGAAPAKVAPQPEATETRPAGDADTQTVETPEGLKVTPVAQRVAAAQGIDLGKVQGTGPNGRIGKADVLNFGDAEHVLRYEHFSVVYNKKRRMCFYSACNIDGARSKSSKRAQWRFDPRIPTALQIMKECYGNAPKFSRGHMTRREDPAWGTARSIQRGSDDSMHVTNATPQMQSFNSQTWLELEDYALQNAREDKQKISVFTGPYFTRNDPTMFGVRIPLKFWKVIAFVHDETGELCATGYEMSQEDNLQETEFVFGQFTSSHLNLATQASIASIEARSGLSFGQLADIDPFGQEGPEFAAGPLTRFEQIRFF
jgi:endonuclease G